MRQSANQSNLYNSQLQSSMKPQQQQTLSPSRSTIGLTSQQKDLVIIHLKSEVYELKQSESDYRSLLQQVQQLEERLKYLKDEKDIALRDYQSKVSSQEKQIDMAKRELDELQRINGNKDTDNRDTLTKIKSDKDFLKQTDNDYKSLRDQNDYQLQQNKHLKDEIALLEDQITEEKRRSIELRAVKDKLSHQLYRGAEDSDQLIEKEQELMRKLKDKEHEQKLREEKLRLLDREHNEKDNHLVHQRTQQASEETRAVQVKNSLQLQEDENHRLLEQQKRMKEQLHLEDIKQQELHTRLREINQKIARRDDENEQILSELRVVDRDIELLKEKYENLILERNALKEHSDRILDANKEIEKELDSFVNLDDSIVKTLEKRDNNLSPVISQYRPNLTNANIAQQSITSNYGLQPSRMFDLQSAESAKIYPYQKIQADYRTTQNPQQNLNQLNPNYQSQARLQDLYQQSHIQSTQKHIDNNLLQSTNYDDFQRNRHSLGGADQHSQFNQSQLQQNYQSSYAAQQQLSHNSQSQASLKFLNPRNLGSPNQSQQQSSISNYNNVVTRGNQHQNYNNSQSSTLGIQRELQNMHLDKPQRDQNGYDRKRHSPLRQNI